MSKPASDIAVVVSSCDSFRDAWAPFFYFFARHWPDCPWPVYLITNHGVYVDPVVKCLPVGRDLGWSTNLRTAMKTIGAANIIYLQEDYFFTKPVETGVLVRDVAFLREHQAAYLGLYPVPTPDELQFAGSGRIGRLAPGAEMRVSLQAAIWDSAKLDSLLVDGESGWDIERYGSDRSREMTFLRMNSFETTPLSYFFTAIKRGAWEPEAVQMCRDEGIHLDLGFRAVRPETRWQKTSRKWRFRYYHLLQLLFPRKFEVKALPR